ncbi:MAG TPA: hypothetical protein VGO90_13030 [Chthoniobacteraceae bacterium]|jgi:hypothetical protein|nr:hypothetical protein [Chthoniobacter sp.]HEV7868602.1 hypothetical protein [Chthoniobacteraceae bacterium]
MSVEARVTPRWKNQKLFLALFLSAVGAWFFIDGYWVWPRSNERWLMHDRYKGEKRMDEWPGYARSRGWKEVPPHKYYDRDAIMGQFVFGAIASLLGTLTLAYWLTQKNRRITVDDEAVVTPAGTRVPFAAITGLGLKKWEAKGLATVRYELAGRKGQFVLDDYKFERERTEEILKEIERRLVERSTPADQIDPGPQR